MKQATTQSPPKPAVVSLAQLLTEQPASPPPGWIEPGLLPPEGILFVGGEPKVGKSLLVANLALALAAGKDRAGFRIPAARRVLVCQFELPTPQFVSRLASMRRSVGAVADQNLLVDTRAIGHLLVRSAAALDIIRCNEGEVPFASREVRTLRPGRKWLPRSAFETGLPASTRSRSAWPPPDASEGPDQGQPVSAHGREGLE